VTCASLTLHPYRRAPRAPPRRRSYEAIAAKCVPVVLSDRFVLPYDAPPSAHRGGVLPPRAVDSFVMRVPEAAVAQLPTLLAKASGRHDAMLKALLEYRSMFLYELPLQGQPAAGGAVCAIVAELWQRFGPHLHAWRHAPDNLTTAVHPVTR
jgi:hypothetical protein